MAGHTAQKPQCGCDWRPWRHMPLAGSPSHPARPLGSGDPQGPGEQTLAGEIFSQAGGEPRLPPCLLMCPRLPSEDQAVVEQVNLATDTADTWGPRLRVNPQQGKQGACREGASPSAADRGECPPAPPPSSPPAIPGGSGMGRSLGGGRGRGQVASSPESCRNRRATRPAAPRPRLAPARGPEAGWAGAAPGALRLPRGGAPGGVCGAWGPATPAQALGKEPLGHARAADTPVLGLAESRDVTKRWCLTPSRFGGVCSQGGHKG